MNSDEALAVAIDLLKRGHASNYGYDYCPYHVARQVANEVEKDPLKAEQKASEYWSLFADAGWFLCQRGILRPGVNRYEGQAVPEGRYSFTSAGREKLGTLDNSTVLLYQSSSLLDTFSGFEKLFGEGFVQRSSEAVSCRDAGLWLASCVMSGAAAEAVLLAIAIVKTGDEKTVMQKYRAAGGRKQILDLITGAAKQHIRDTLKDFTGIIAAWRDEAGHGTATQISAANADEGLRQLLHMCQWVEKNWDKLT